VDHGFGTGGKGLVIAGQAAAQHAAAETALYCPASLDHLEPAGVGVSVDDSYLDSEAGVVDGGVLESGVDPGPGYGQVGLVAATDNDLPGGTTTNPQARLLLLLPAFEDATAPQEAVTAWPRPRTRACACKTPTRSPRP
jgi:hypothetical protein